MKLLFCLGLVVVLGLAAIVIFVPSPTIATWALICGAGLVAGLCFALNSTRGADLRAEEIHELR